MSETSRESNFELLRIFSIILILFHHFSLNYGENVGWGGTFLFDFLYLGGQIGVNCFVLITGFFMVKSKIKIERIISIILQTTVFSSILFCICVVIGEKSFSVREVGSAVLPILFNTYWYVTTYVGLFFLIPIINRLLRVLDKEKYLMLLTILTVKDVLLPTIACNYLTSNLDRFIELYCIGGFIRMFEHNKDTNKWWKVCSGFSYLILYISVITAEIIGKYIPGILKHKFYFTAGNKIIVMFISVSIFMMFKEMKVKDSNVVNKIGAATFGIYIFHAGYGEKIIWKNLLRADRFDYTNVLLSSIYIISAIVFMFVLGLGADIVYKKSIGKLFKQMRFIKLNSKLNFDD